MDLEIHQLVLRYASLRVIDPGRVSRLAASIAREGQQTPVLVARGGALVDGYHRVQALQSLGRDLVIAMSLEDVSEAEALVLSWRLETGRRRTAMEEGWLLAELVETHKRSQSALAAEMHRPRSWVSQRLGLVRTLPEAAQEAVRAGRIPAEAAARSLLPMARISGEAVARLVRALPEPVSKRQVEQLWSAWRRADAEGRARIEAHPALLLRVEEATEILPPDAVEQLVRDFEAIAGLCRRARTRWHDGVFARANNRALRGAWTQAQESFLALKEEVYRARSGDTNSDSEAAR